MKRDGGRRLRMTVIAVFAAVLVFSLASWEMRQSNGSEQASVARRTATNAYAQLSLPKLGENMAVPLAPKTKPKLILLTFLKLDRSEGNESRSQAVFIRSMDRQYRASGVVAQVIEAGYVYNGTDTEPESAINLSNSWNLEEMPVFRDSIRDGAAAAMGVTRLPTTLLLSGTGEVLERWSGLALTGQLALAIQGRLAGEDVTGDAATVFPGLPAARKLSDELWMVDGGTSWTIGERRLVRFLMIRPPGEPLDETVVTVTPSGGGSAGVIRLNASRIPVEESTVLLRGFTEREGFELYESVTQELNVSSAGSYRIRVEARNEGMKQAEGFVDVMVQAKQEE